MAEAIGQVQCMADGDLGGCYQARWAWKGEKVAHLNQGSILSCWKSLKNSDLCTAIKQQLCDR